MESKEKRSSKKPHVLALPYPSQGHINPQLQLCKRLHSKGLRTTLAVTTFISHSINPDPISPVHIETISDGCDQAGFAQADGVHDYLDRLQSIGSKTLADLINKYKNSDHPIDCIIYDAYLPWALEVARWLGLIGAAFFSQPCAVDFIYICVCRGVLELPVRSVPVELPGLPALELRDMPSFIYKHGSYPAYFELMLNQFRNVDRADFVLVNSFYELEAEAVETMSKQVCPVMTVGPTIPSSYLDNQVPNDLAYGLDLYHLDRSAYTNWLSNKPKGSVLYVSTGSMADIEKDQMEELTWGLENSNFYYLWVVRDSEKQKLPKSYLEKQSEKGLLVGWVPQLEILSSGVVGCFFSHCGWNSVVEALSLGVPMVAMPQWTDQLTNAKFVEDVWKVGIRVRVCEEKGIVRREEVERCVREVMEGERGKQMKENALKWRKKAREAVCKGGSSDRNIDEFVSKLTTNLY